MKLLKKIIWLLVLAALAICGWFFTQNSNKETPAYRTEKITRGNISAVVSANGTLNPVQFVTVGSQVSGKVNKTYVKVNDHVKVGQLLAEIDPALLLAQIKQDNSALESAKVAYEQAERDLKRSRMLLAKDFIAKHELEIAEQTELQAKNSYDSAKTAIERDVVNLNYAKITSPIDGVIIGQTVTEGQTLQASFTAPDLFKIAGNLAEMKIDVNFSESDITKVKVDMPVTFTVNAFPERIFNGKVKTVNFNPSSQPGQAVTYSVVIDLKNEDGALLPGMTAYVSVILSQQKNVLRLPLSALRFNPPKEHVNSIGQMFGGEPAKQVILADDRNGKTKTIYTLKQDILTPLQVKVGESDDAYIEVTGDNISEGQEIVIGTQKIRKN